MIKKVFALGCEWFVSFNYYAGTNHLITSQSLEPNDDPEIEILSVSSESGQIPEEIYKLIEDDLWDTIESELWDSVNRGNIDD